MNFFRRFSRSAWFSFSVSVAAVLLALITRNLTIAAFSVYMISLFFFFCELPKAIQKTGNGILIGIALIIGYFSVQRMTLRFGYDKYAAPIWAFPASAVFLLTIFYFLLTAKDDARENPSETNKKSYEKARIWMLLSFFLSAGLLLSFLVSYFFEPGVSFLFCLFTLMEAASHFRKEKPES